MATRWTTPTYSKNRVKTAGKRIRRNQATDEDWDVLENHRRAHARTLNTHQIRLRRVLTNIEFSVAQRLKRRPTIIDKLRREPKMQLSTMHDIAGCRVIFNSLGDLIAYRNDMLKKPTRHVHMNRGNEHFNYIKYPKSSGYRGIHEVYKTKTGRTDAKAWDDLLIEVQLRTKAQHAWATAVETIDLLNGERAKFGEADAKLERLFVLASEIISRAHEKHYSSLPNLKNALLLEEFSDLDGRMGIIKRLDEAVEQNPQFTKKRTTILIFHFGKGAKLEIRTFKDISEALPQYEQLEEKYRDKADIVLVRGEKVEDIRRSFQNYFSDAKDFVKLINQGKRLLADGRFKFDA